jgi:hypothetical protein
MNPTTFGNSQAAINLADMLVKAPDDVRVRKIASFVNHYSNMIVGISKIEDDLVRKWAYHSLIKEIVSFDFFTENETIYFTHAKNILRGRIRTNMERDKNPAPGVA